MSRQTDPPLVDPLQLQQQLEDKNQLVRALTERLEEAAEQLDRIKRSGGTNGSRGGGGQSSESHAQQQSLIEQLTRSVELWDDVQPRDAFERIESRLDDLRELLENGIVSDGGAGKSPPQKDPLAGWEKMKAQLLQESSSAAPPPANPTTRSESPPPATAVATAGPPSLPTTGPEAAVPLQPLDEMQLPAPVNFEEAERQDLEEAIERRDQYISYLTRRLRSAECRTHQQINWEVLNNAPDELRESLQQLEAELNDRLRIAEVDLSLERARLSRVETRVRGMQQQIEQRLKSVGHGLPQAEETPAPKKESKSWFGSLGR